MVFCPVVVVGGGGCCRTGILRSNRGGGGVTWPVESEGLLCGLFPQLLRLVTDARGSAGSREGEVGATADEVEFCRVREEEGECLLRLSIPCKERNTMGS